jgi:hypothetical protein
MFVPCFEAITHIHQPRPASSCKQVTTTMGGVDSRCAASGPGILEGLCVSAASFEADMAKVLPVPGRWRWAVRLGEMRR